MQRKEFLVAFVVLAMLGAPLSASDRKAEEPAPAPGLERQAENAPPPAPAPAAPPVAEAAPQLPPLSPELAALLGATAARLPAGEQQDRAALARFYEARRSDFLWVTGNGFTASAQAAIAELGQADAWGLDAAAFAVKSPAPGASAAEQAEAEVALSLAILKYARHARGGRTDPVSLSRYFDRKPALLPPEQVIEEAARSADVDIYLRSLHPRHHEFHALRQKYLEARRAPPPPPAPIAQAPKDPKKKAAAPAAPPPSNARRILVNMEQWRWMPEDLGDYYVWVNIPEFMIRVVSNGRVIHAERVIVGKPNTQTPIFSDEMEQVIFHPFWGVPNSIKKNELLPSLARGNTGILEKHHLRVSQRGRDVDPASVDWAKADMRQFHVYQPPGSANVLGVVKFRFPNKHDVYMHDTPTKNLFNAAVRTFSHGCMRVRDPVRLAELLLGEDKGWPASRVAAAVGGTRQDVHVNLTRRFPVHITYFTASVEDDGKLKLHGDIYGHENRIGLGIDGKAHLIVREKEEGPVQAEAISALSETKTGGGRPDWVRRAFGN